MLMVPQEELELSGRYELDPAHTRVGFAARDAMVPTLAGRVAELGDGAVRSAEDPFGPSAALELGGFLISDEVTLELDVSAIRTP